MVCKSQTQAIVWDEFPEDYPSVEFRLIYDGPLKAAGAGRGGTRSSEKHEIRKEFHKQLAQLWKAIPHLNMRTERHSILSAPPTQLKPDGSVAQVRMAAATVRPSLLETLGNSFDRCGYRFVPLISNYLKLSCALEIIFLRRDMPGTPLIRSGGDIDNRLKVLFDALRIPSDCSELAGAQKDTDEEPYFYCLMEDDALITEVAVTTDTL